MAQWYYSDPARNRLGPVDASDLVGLHANGHLQADTLVWREGMADWHPWHTVMAEVLASAEPAAPPPAPRTLADGVNPYELAAAPAPAPAAPAGADSPYAPPTARLADLGGYRAGGAVVYAGFWKRAAAYMIDTFLLGIAIWIVQVVVMGAFFGTSMGAFATGEPSALMAGGLAGMLFGLLLIPIGLQAVYFAAFHASARQATPGKMAVGIKVTGEQGHRISFGLAIGRYFATILSGLILYVGYIMAGFTDRKRALHDMLCSTLVVDQWAFTAYPERQNPALGTVATVILVIGGLFVLAYIGLMIVVVAAAAMSGS